MKKIILVLMAGFVLAQSSVAWGLEKGWHKGSYVLLALGAMNVDEDTNVLNRTAFGNDYLLGFGLTYGYNFFDFLALELQTRYATDRAANMKEHAANIDVNAKYSLILNSLTRWEKTKLLPYFKVGGGVFGAAVPDTAAGNNRFGVFGPSMNIAGGMEFLVGRLAYIGVEFTEHFVWLQTKNNAAGQRILNGGFDPQHSFFGYFGVHF